MAWLRQELCALFRGKILWNCVGSWAELRGIKLKKVTYNCSLGDPTVWESPSRQAVLLDLQQSLEALPSTPGSSSHCPLDCRYHCHCRKTSRERQGRPIKKGCRVFRCSSRIKLAAKWPKQHLCLRQLIPVSEQIAFPLNVTCSSCLSSLKEDVTKQNQVHRWIRIDDSRCGTSSV